MGSSFSNHHLVSCSPFPPIARSSLYTLLTLRASYHWNGLLFLCQGMQIPVRLSDRIAPRFQRVEERKRVGRYWQGVLVSVERKHKWQMAEEPTDPNARGCTMLQFCIRWRDDLNVRLVLTILGSQQEHMPDPWVLVLERPTVH